jgi:hexosaminidase
LGFAAGAAYSWALESNRTLDLPAAINCFAFDNPTSSLGQIAYDLGNVYRAVNSELTSESSLFYIMQMPLEKVQEYKDTIPSEKYHRALEIIESAIDLLTKIDSTRSDYSLLRQEFDFAARMLRHACWRGLLAYGVPIKDTAALASDLESLIETHQQIWLSRNRPGGLPDSLARLERLRQDYYLR